MKYCKVLLMLIWTTSIGYSQTNQGESINQNIEQLGDAGSANAVRLFDNRYEGVRGTPFHSEDWEKANIKTRDGVKENIKSKLNLEQYQIYGLMDNDQVSQLNRDVIEYIEFGSGRIFVNTSTLDDWDGETVFLELLSKGKNGALYALRSKVLKKADFKGSYSSGTQYDEYKSKTQYFFESSNSKIFKIKTKTRDIASLLDLDEKLLKKFMKKESIGNVKNEQELTKLFRNYNNGLIN